MLNVMKSEDSSQEFEKLPRFQWRTKEGRFVTPKLDEKVSFSTKTLESGSKIIFHMQSAKSGFKNKQSYVWDSTPGSGDSYPQGAEKVEPVYIVDVTVNGERRSWFAQGKVIYGTLEKLFNTAWNAFYGDAREELNSKGLAAFGDFSVVYRGTKSFTVEFEEDGVKKQSELFEPTFSELELVDAVSPEPAPEEPVSKDETEDEIPF